MAPAGVLLAFALFGCETTIAEPPPPPTRFELAQAPPGALGAHAAAQVTEPTPTEAQSPSEPGGESEQPDGGIEPESKPVPDGVSL